MRSYVTLALLRKILGNGEILLEECTRFFMRFLNVVEAMRFVFLFGGVYGFRVLRRLGFFRRIFGNATPKIGICRIGVLGG